MIHTYLCSSYLKPCTLRLESLAPWALNLVPYTLLIRIPRLIMQADIKPFHFFFIGDSQPYEEVDQF